MSKVTAVIPCHNHGKYLNDAVDSILNQTYKDCEIIVVNDNSTDKFTINLLCNYTKPKTNVIHVEYKQPCATRNHGIRETDSEYILTLDADDKFAPTFLEKAVKILDENPEIGVVTCFMKSFGRSQGRWKPRGGSIKDFLVRNNCTASALFRRECWTNVGGFNEEMTSGFGDWDFWIAITKQGWLVRSIPEFLLYYRKHGASRNTDSEKKRPDITRQIVNNHREVYEKYVDFIIYAKEMQILQLKRKRETFYILFSIPRKILSFFKKIIKGSPTNQK